MNAVNIFLLLACFCQVIRGQWIVEKHPLGMIEAHDDWWAIKSNVPVNRPMFQAYIRFYNTHTAKNDYEVDCSRSPLVLYHHETVVFRTTGYLWTPQTTYYITIDEGALYSNTIENSTEQMSPKFWTFDVGYSSPL